MADGEDLPFVNAARLFDISIMADGKKVEPKAPVEVKIEYTNAESLNETSEVGAVHFKESLLRTETEVLDVTVQGTEGQMDGVTFKADAFSIYAVVIIDKEEGSFVFEDEKYKVTITYTKEANIPIGTELTVKEITDDKEYDSLWSQTVEKMNEGVKWENEDDPDPRKGITDAVFFDISLIHGDKEIEPDVPLDVDIELKEGGVLLLEEEEAKIVHFAKNETEIIDELSIVKDEEESQYGYYLLVADDGAPTLALVTTDVTIVEKNTYISASKTAEEAAYQIGDKVEYTATVVIPANTALTQEAGEDDVDEDEDGYVDGHAPIILHDTMDSTLTFAGEIKEATGIAADGYTLVTEPEDNCTFELVIPVTEDLLGKTITFKYEAEVNSTAAGEDGLVNELKGEFNGYETTPDSPVVYTFDFSFKKLFDGSEDENLTATFVLQDANGTVIPLTKIDDTHYAVKDSDDTAVTDNLITIKNGQEINIKGLKEATYKLVEKSTDTGYNLLDAPVTIVITDETDAGEDNVIQDSEIARSITVDGEELGENVYTFDVVNNQGSVLPSTGGIGTTIFYIVGSILVIGAGVVLVTRRRMNVQ